MSANMGKLNFYGKPRANLETVAKIQDIQVT
jgi:hypothetical protein